MSFFAELLAYPEDTAGGIMNPACFAMGPAETVDDAIDFLRTTDEATPINAVYVVDESRRLLGFVRLRRMVTARPAARLGDIMSTDVISVSVDTDQEAVADLVDKYDFLAIPVVDSEQQTDGSGHRRRRARRHRG